MLKFASAGTIDALRGLISEFYFCTPAAIVLDGGAVYKNGVKMSTEYAKQGRRWIFYKKAN